MPKPKESNVLQIWGNKDSMNLNSMILTNIQSSLYFKKDLYELKTYHEVIDEIYYRVSHLEPWEKGSRKTQGLTGMCGGVRGVGGGGIVSTAFCILYKLYTLKLTRKQVIGLLHHTDSPYIRGLGFMYIRYTQAPQDLFDWFDEYLDDPEEIDVKAGGGYMMTIGSMLKQWLTRLEWFETLFPRIPVPIQNEISMRLEQRYRMKTINNNGGENGGNEMNGVGHEEEEEEENGGRSSRDVDTRRSRSRSRRTHSKSRSNSRSGDDRHRKSAKHGRDKDRDRDRSHSRHRHHHRKHHKHHRDRKSKSRSRDREEGARGDSSSSKNGKHRHRHHRHHHSNSPSKSKSPENSSNSKKRSSRSRSHSKNREKSKKQRTESP